MLSRSHHARRYAVSASTWIKLSRDVISRAKDRATKNSCYNQLLGLLREQTSLFHHWPLSSRIRSDDVASCRRMARARCESEQTPADFQLSRTAGIPQERGPRLISRCAARDYRAPKSRARWFLGALVARSHRLDKTLIHRLRESQSISAFRLSSPD